MTDRISALSVVLSQDMREDDVRALVEAISLFSGVLQVSTRVADLSEHIAHARVRRELSDALWKVLQQ